MNALRKIGDALLSKFVPEAEAQAASCATGCPSYKEYDCKYGLRRFERCCYHCTQPYCSAWRHTGWC
ncbi:hypothetical protein [Streptomyces albipurpureus]|uniref:Transposase n=1 Tax=Streptomyces albipurpureus TaxID=2897419 RepID=A0ABT0V0D7_9ACTN|nr:hypothetical protein [Streptomyces sp. CWNU-1]MCM2394186.1 hypothetical protein [Streptomyces sp. CWNU-1]